MEASTLSSAAAQIAPLAPWVLAAPLIGLLINLVIGKRIGEVGIGLTASLATAASFVLAAMMTVLLLPEPEAVRVVLADWINVGSLNLPWALRVDTLSLTMMLVVSGVGTLIHVYATAYMHSDVRHNGDPARYRRFFVYFNLFILAMLILVSADNFVMLFVGWEGVGLCSYLLIGFWFEKGEGGLGNAKAAKKAFTVNRVGDFGLLIALFLIFWNFGTFNFDAVFEQVPQLAAAAPGVLTAIGLFMLLGVTGKSAQLPLYIWLPDAMAGPTPVSALIHAATMVTAGVYLVARSAAIYAAAPLAMSVVMWVGAATALFAATIAVAQTDIKKVLAYSTISQLGFMVAAVGMGAYVAGMFHLITHAFFKALLFLSAGSVILGVEHGHAVSHGGHHEANHDGGHNAFDPQDMRNMGGLQSKMPVTFWVYLIGALALAGIAPLAGFFSKDEILAAAAMTNPVLVVMLVSAAFLTAFYMGRQVFMVFFGKARTTAAERAHESPALITVPLGVLAVLSALGGALNLPGVYTLEHWLEHTIETGLKVEANWVLAGVTVALALAAIFLAWLLYGKRMTPASAPDPLQKNLGGLFAAMKNKWWVDELYEKLFIQPYRDLSRWFARTVDQGGIDGLVNGIGSLSAGLSGMLRSLQNGFVRSYTLTLVVGVVVILAYLLLR